ncbi:hypothetical protein GH714_027555 [Hevea brasiliensis]|uniref:Endonuclease/exonuclease/phosphatase domain-containing protein n=1 Tax=Hevea brasiliensis TaxID=3981 RepID=A0A6A6LE85_HEVBR|nr:hypothetical protein GH714_027555 [Hevea brasiliensis]
MKRLQEELDNVVGLNRMVEEKDLPKLTYLDMVIKESLRLRSVGPLLIPHESTEDIIVKGYHIPSKSRIMVNAWALGRDPNALPDNAEEFLPKRFKDTNIDLRGHDFQLLPFGSGRKGCPGMHLGLTTVRLVLGQLLHCFDRELPHGLSPNEMDMSEKFTPHNAQSNPFACCPKEVDRYYDLLKVMEKAGYAGSYKRRTGDYADGCAMFWKADKFRLLEGESIEFKALGLRDNVAQLSVFEILEDESRRLLVGNIHVLYSPNRGEIKLGQIRLLLSRAQILAEKWGNIPVVLAGDFNSTPQSAIYKFLASSELNIMLYDRKELSGQRTCDPAQVLGLEKELRNPLYLMDRILKTCWTREAIKVATGDPDCQLLTHPLKLNSSYAALKGSTRTRDLNGEPLATSYHSKFLGTVDYLWYSDGVVPIRVLDTLPFNTLKRTGGLPCKKLGSDHLALVSEFAFKRGAKEGSATNIATVSAAATSSSREDNKST